MTNGHEQPVTVHFAALMCSSRRFPHCATGLDLAPLVTRIIPMLESGEPVVRIGIDVPLSVIPLDRENHEDDPPTAAARVNIGRNTRASVSCQFLYPICRGQAYWIALLGVRKEEQREGIVAHSVGPGLLYIRNDRRTLKVPKFRGTRSPIWRPPGRRGVRGGSYGDTPTGSLRACRIVIVIESSGSCDRSAISRAPEQRDRQPRSSR
jgi:hypothetical protein